MRLNTSDEKVEIRRWNCERLQVGWMELCDWVGWIAAVIHVELIQFTKQPTQVSWAWKYFSQNSKILESRDFRWFLMWQWPIDRLTISVATHFNRLIAGQAWLFLLISEDNEGTAEFIKCNWAWNRMKFISNCAHLKVSESLPGNIAIVEWKNLRFTD